MINYMLSFLKLLRNIIILILEAVIVPSGRGTCLENR